MKNKTCKIKRTNNAFTLVELLVVIAIIGILAGMVLAVLPKVVNSTKRAKAKLEAQDIVTAILAYDSAYGRFPVSTNAQTAAAGGDYTYGGTGHDISGNAAWTVPIFFSSLILKTNDEVIAILMNLTTYPNGSGPTINNNYVKNPQKTIFLNAKMSGDTSSPGVGTDLVYRDPWGNPYMITMDLNYDEESKDAFYCQNNVSGFNQTSANPGVNGLVNPDTTKSDNFQFHGKVMVWSAGPDRKISATAAANQGDNKDNVTSW